MHKNFWVGILLFCMLPLWAEVSVLSVVDEDKHSRKEDFWHTFEYYAIGPNGKAGKCQATRVAKNWFATAAHCVADLCAAQCTLRMDLLEQPVSAFVDAKHTVKKPIVFVHPSYASRIGKVKYDVALFRMNLSLLPAQYYRRPLGAQTENVAISRAAFQKFLRQHPAAQREFNRALRPELPPILVFGNTTKRIDRQLSVVSIFDGKRSILHNPNPTDYVQELGFAYTQNFGVKKGMSGSGVMTNTGELAGIISGMMILGMPSGSKKENYFMFPVFNENLMQFMEQTMGGDYYELDRREASAGYVKKSPKDHRAVVQALQNASNKSVKQE